jgi:glutamine amidotransferase
VSSACGLEALHARGQDRQFDPVPHANAAEQATFDHGQPGEDSVGTINAADFCGMVFYWGTGGDRRPRLQSGCVTASPPLVSARRRPSTSRSSSPVSCQAACTMCELLALSSSQCEHLTFSLHTLAERGGLGMSTRDGWGVAFYQGVDVALFREPRSAGESELVRHLESHGPGTKLAISHIRHATRGAITLANTQPFARELGGRMHVFAHNGNLPGIDDSVALAPGAHRPIGQTDSELAFCALLARLGALWAGDGVPALDARAALLATFAADLRPLGPANFLYADGDALFAHGNRRMQGAKGPIAPPGLWLLQRHCKPGDPAPDCGGGVAIGPGERTVVLIASVPLSDDAWRPLSEGELVVVREGAVIAGRFPT